MESPTAAPLKSAKSDGMFDLRRERPIIFYCNGTPSSSQSSQDHKDPHDIVVKQLKEIIARFQVLEKKVQVLEHSESPFCHIPNIADNSQLVVHAEKQSWISRAAEANRSGKQEPLHRILSTTTVGFDPEDSSPFHVLKIYQRSLQLAF